LTKDTPIDAVRITQVPTPTAYPHHAEERRSTPGFCLKKTTPPKRLPDCFRASIQVQSAAEIKNRKNLSLFSGNHRRSPLLVFGRE
jgi:hypothetical protein